MPDSSAMLTLAIISALIVYTGSVISLVMWLNNKFRALEKTFYKELDRRRIVNDGKFFQLGTKIQRLEIKAFGFTGPTLIEPTVEYIEPK